MRYEDHSCDSCRKNFPLVPCWLECALIFIIFETIEDGVEGKFENLDGIHLCAPLRDSNNPINA